MLTRLKYKWTRTWKVKKIVETSHNLARLVLTIDCSPETRLTYLSWAIATISMLVKHSITSTHSVQYYHQNAAAICCAALKKKVSHSRQIGLVKFQITLVIVKTMTQYLLLSMVLKQNEFNGDADFFFAFLSLFCL